MTRIQTVDSNAEDPVGMTVNPMRTELTKVPAATRADLEAALSALQKGETTAEVSAAPSQLSTCATQLSQASVASRQPST